MYIFRNKQFFRLFLLTAILLAGAAIGVFFFSPVASAIVLAAGVLVLLVLIIDARSRYQAMERLSTELDEILHDNDRFLITECEEGELAILSSSIRKMTLKLKEQASKLTDEKKVLTDAIADIFHQMRTPLTSMRLSCSMLSEEDIPYEERIRFVRGIKKQLERMQWLVETLLKMSKIEAGTVTFKKERLDVHELVQKACEPLLIPLELRDTFSWESVENADRYLLHYGDSEIYTTATTITLPYVESASFDVTARAKSGTCYLDSAKITLTGEVIAPADPE